MGTGLRFTFGKFAGLAQPGLNFVIPGVQQLVKIDTRMRNRDLPQQTVITPDNVTAWIDAVVYLRSSTSSARRWTSRLRGRR